MQMNIDYPAIKINQRTDFSKMTIDSPFIDKIDVNKLIKDYETCLDRNNLLFFIEDNDVMINVLEVNRRDIKYLFIPDIFNSKLITFHPTQEGLHTIDTIFFPESLRTTACYNLAFSTSKYIYIPKNLESYNDDFFKHNAQLKTLIIESPADISAHSFECNINLDCVLLNNDITYIGTNAFESCYRLTKINLPQKLRTIDDLAFTNCGLKEITIPNSVKEIGSYAFHNCPLEKIIFKNINNLILSCDSFTSKVPCTVIIEENDEELAKEWIENNKDAFNENITFKIIKKQVSIQEVINNFVEKCLYENKENKDFETER